MMEGPDKPSTPPAATEDTTSPSATDIDTTKTDATEAAETDTEGSPGFGVMIAFSILAVVYLIRKRN